MVMQLKIIGKGHENMITSAKAVINAMIVVLFLTMIIFSPTVYNFAFFAGIFYYLWKIESDDKDTF